MSVLCPSRSIIDRRVSSSAAAGPPGVRSGIADAIGDVYGLQVHHEPEADALEGPEDHQFTGALVGQAT